LIGPKDEKSKVQGTRYHVKNPPGVGWIYEETKVDDVRFSAQLLARVLIAKIEDRDRLVAILRNIPVIQNDPHWRCRSWVANALAELAKDGKAVGTSRLSWTEIETIGREYVARKKAEGRYQRLDIVMAPRPTWDSLQEKETIP
jgi:hypothetical protein